MRTLGTEKLCNLLKITQPGAGQAIASDSKIYALNLDIDPSKQISLLGT